VETKEEVSKNVISTINVEETEEMILMNLIF
jgi:hypothetical protein